MAIQLPIPTRVALLEQARETDRDDIAEIKTAFATGIAEVKGMVTALDSKMNKCLLGACGVLFTAVFNLVIAYTRLGK